MTKEYILKKVSRQIGFVSSGFFMYFLTGYLGDVVIQEGIKLIDEEGNTRIIWEKLKPIEFEKELGGTQ